MRKRFRVRQRAGAHRRANVSEGDDAESASAHGDDVVDMDAVVAAVGADEE